MRNGTKLLRTAGFIQILLGLAVILSTYFLIGSTSADSFSVPAEKALLLLTATYAGGAFQILAGIAGILLSKKKTLLTVIFGVLLVHPSAYRLSACGGTASDCGKHRSSDFPLSLSAGRLQKLERVILTRPRYPFTFKKPFLPHVNVRRKGFSLFPIQSKLPSDLYRIHPLSFPLFPGKGLFIFAGHFNRLRYSRL